MKELKVKVCGMRDPQNIDEVCKANPDFLGYIFHPKSSRYVGDSPDLSIFTRVPSSTKKVGVFVNEEAEKVIEICKEYKLKVAQLHGKESPDYCRQIRENGFLVFKAFSLDESFDFNILKDYISVVDYFLFDTKGKLPGGTGVKFNWELLNKYKLENPFFLSGGIGPDDYDGITTLNNKQLYALDINSGFEIEPALKDAEKVKAFIEKVRN